MSFAISLLSMVSVADSIHVVGQRIVGNIPQFVVVEIFLACVLNLTRLHAQSNLGTGPRRGSLSGRGRSSTAP